MTCRGQGQERGHGDSRTARPTVSTCHAGFFLERVGGALEAHRGEGLQHEVEELDAVRAEHGVRRWLHFVFFFKFFKDFFFYARHSMH